MGIGSNRLGGTGQGAFRKQTCPTRSQAPASDRPNTGRMLAIRHQVRHQGGSRSPALAPGRTGRGAGTAHEILGGGSREATEQKRKSSSERPPKKTTEHPRDSLRLLLFGISRPGTARASQRNRLLDRTRLAPGDDHKTGEPSQVSHHARGPECALQAPPAKTC